MEPQKYSTFKTMISNLSKGQKIAIVAISQAIIIVLFIASINAIFNNKTHVEVQDDGELSNIPSEEMTGFENVLWNIISRNYDNVDKTVIKDVKVREGTYTETKDESTKNTTANFVVDIDSLKQTYAVTIEWSKSEDLPDGIMIECPPITDMKYPETFCKGMYTTTNSFSLYFPHFAYKNDDEIKNDDENYDSGILYIIDGDEESKTINIESSVCNPEQYNQEALEYIKENTPFYNNPEYTIKYSVNSVDVICN